MSTEANKALVRRYYEEVLAKRNSALVDELFATNYVYHYPDTPPNLPPGLEGFKQFVTMYLSGYANLHFTIEDQIAEGDKVVTRVTAHSSNIGPLRSIPENPETATRADNITGISIERIADDKIVESWAEFDLLAMQQQAGVMPSMGQTKQ